MSDGDLLLLYMTIKHLCTEQTDVSKKQHTLFEQPCDILRASDN